MRFFFYPLFIFRKTSPCLLTIAKNWSVSDNIRDVHTRIDVLEDFYRFFIYIFFTKFQKTHHEGERQLSAKNGALSRILYKIKGVETEELENTAAGALSTGTQNYRNRLIYFKLRSFPLLNNILILHIFYNTYIIVLILDTFF